MAVIRANLFPPSTVIVQKISEPPRMSVKTQPQESQVTMREAWILPVECMVRVFMQKSRYDERPRVVIGRITFACIGHGEDCMLQNARIICQPRQMSGIQYRQLIGSAIGRIFLLCRLGLQGALETGALKTCHVLSRRFGPYCFP